MREKGGGGVSPYTGGRCAGGGGWAAAAMGLDGSDLRARKSKAKG